MSIGKGEEILLVGLQQVARKLGDVHDEPREIIERASALIDATLNMFEKEAPIGKPAVQWNPGEYGVSKPLEWFDEGFKAMHPAVRGTSYMEVRELVETSGCSPEEPYWVWSALGVIETKRGKLLVCPNDWIIETAEGLFTVVPDPVYKALYKEPSNADSKSKC
jgi:hypothetical protein